MFLLTFPLFICLWLINISAIDAIVDCSVYSKQIDIVNQNPFYVRLALSSTSTSILYNSSMDLINAMTINGNKNPSSNIFCLKNLTALRLINTTLTLLPDIQNLKSLTTLQITSDNGALGQYLPVEIGELKSLTSLDLSKIQYLRDLPSEIGQLTLLQSLSLSEIPNLEYLPDLDMSQLTELRMLNLNNVPKLFNLPAPMDSFQKLQTFILRETNVPDLLLQNLQELTILRISANLAMTSIHVGNMPKLTTLEITYNVGLTALTLENMPKLSTVDLTRNVDLITLTMENLTISQSLLLTSNDRLKSITMHNIGALKSFSASSAQHLHRVTLKNFTGLTSFTLMSNPILESVSIDNALQLTNVNLSSNPILKTIVFTNTPSVNSLNLSSCQLTSLPAIVLTLTNLKTLVLQYNEISVLPATLSADLPHLEFLDLSYNKFQGNIMQPPLIYVRVLYITNNELTTLDGINEYRSLERLYVDYNNITSIPTNILELSTKLRLISINSNQLNSIPYPMTNMRVLSELNGRNNRISVAEINNLYNVFYPSPISLNIR